MRDLGGRVVLLTGAAGGIGRPLARGFASSGARVALTGRSEGPLEELRRELVAGGAAAIGVVADVSDPSSLAQLVATVKDELGSVDVLVNNAGVEWIWDFETLTLERIETMVRTNLLGSIALTRLVVPDMVAQRSGHIVNIASIAGVLPVPHNTTYSATKHGMVGFTHSLRLELAEHGVGVSAICPTAVEAGLFTEWGREAPKATGSVPPEAVVRAVLDAIRRNRAEVIVGKRANRLAAIARSISPDLVGFMLRRSGVFDFVRDQARMNAEAEAARAVRPEAEGPPSAHRG